MDGAAAKDSSEAGSEVATETVEDMESAVDTAKVGSAAARAATREAAMAERTEEGLAGAPAVAEGSEPYQHPRRLRLRIR